MRFSDIRVYQRFFKHSEVVLRREVVFFRRLCKRGRFSMIFFKFLTKCFNPLKVSQFIILLDIGRLLMRNFSA